MYYALFRFFPKKHLSRLMGWLASVRWPGFMLGPVIGLYIRIYRIDMTQFLPAPEGAWRNFNAFFTRAIRPEARPVEKDKATLVSPVDGAVVEAGTIEQGRLIQAKGRTFSLAQLLGDIPGWEKYEGGDFITLYLSPKDYHRIHTPCAGKVTRFTYIPGDLWTVSPAGFNGVPDLFARNERLVSYLETAFGEVAVVKVGATVVGKIKVVYHEQTSNLPGATLVNETLASPVAFEKAQELGRFELGSTVILLTRPGEARLEPLDPGTTVKMGQAIGKTGK